MIVMPFRRLISVALSLFLVPLCAAPQTAATGVAASAPTAVPPLVPYSGVVEGRSGPATVTFLIFKEEAGGEPLFVETQTVVLDPGGHYKVNLGATLASGLPAGLFSTGEARWLEVQVAGQAPQPRVLLVSVPYALKAADAATLGGLPASAFLLATQLKPTAGLSTVQPEVTSTVTTTGGTAGFVSAFTGASTISNSPIFVSGANVGIGTTNPKFSLQVVGNTVLNGGLSVIGNSFYQGPAVASPIGTATATTGYNSQPFKFIASAWSSATNSAFSPRFQWQAEPLANNSASPSATLNLLWSIANTVQLRETGFYFNADGTMNFAPGQTFPGTAFAGPVSASSVNSTNGYELDGHLFDYSLMNGDVYLGFSGNTSDTGGGNTGVGRDALQSITDGAVNTAIGNLALQSNTEGSDNTAVGYGALGLNTIGGFNTAVGLDALSANITGLSNTAVGYSAGPYAGMHSLANSTAIGANATVSQSNTLALGANTFGSPGASYVNVGIGTTAPRSTLEAAVQSSGALGPVLTLTNSGGGTGAKSAIDFNTNLPSTTGTYNPAARVEALDDNYADDIVFQANKQGHANQGLQTTMTVYPNGNVTVAGTLTAGAKNFQIDHPLDPTNKYLVHSSVESSEMMNIYSGNVTTDELGLATVRLPAWFEAENTDFRYQLTVLDERFAQAVVSKKIQNNQFTIHTNASHVEVSWQITAVRQDAYAKTHPLVVEQEKPERERGFSNETRPLSHDQPASAVDRKFPVPQPPAMPTVKPGLHPVAATKQVAERH
jgi:hypothetical protein